MERQREEDVEGGSNAKRARIKARMKAAKKRLFSFAEDGKLEELQTLLNSVNAENGERAELINSVTDYEETILHLAAEKTNLPMIEWILSDSGGRAAGFNKVLAKSDEGWMALHTAGTLQAFLAIVEGSKVENGERAAMLNAVEEDGETILHYAVRFRCDGVIVGWLLSAKGREAGFNPEYLFAVNNDKESVLHCAAASSSEISTGCLDLILAHCRNAEERCKLLFGVDNTGGTVLHFAALNGRLPIVEWVVSHLQAERGGSNEDLFALTDDKISALHLAAGKGHVEVFDFLLSRCHNTSERLRLFLGMDDRRWAIFHHAAQFRKAEMISHILRNYPEESKMIINARDNRGMTVLHRAIIGGIDKESCDQWGGWHSEEDKQAVVKSLLGLSYVEDEEGGHPEKDAAAMGSDDKGGGKMPIEEKKVAKIAAGGADPNLGLKFD